MSSSSTFASGNEPSDRKPDAVSSQPHLRGKRVAMIVFSYYPSDPRPRRAAEALVRVGMKVDLICLRQAGKDPKRENVNGVDVFRVPLQRRRGGSVGYVLQYAAFLLTCFTVLSVRSITRRYDLVYVHNMPDILVLSALTPKALGAKVILDLHDPMPELMKTIFGLNQDSLGVRTLQRLEKWSIGQAHLAITVNLAFKRLFVSRSCRPEKMQIVMNSPDEEIFGFRAPDSEMSAHQASPGRFVVMYHGSLVERNGLLVAVEALGRLRESVANVELRIYGAETPFLERVMELARAKDLTAAVHYFGPKRLEEIAEAIGQCDVGIIPNERSEFTELNMPTRIFEYLSLGKPVIAPRTTGILDYFNEQSLIFFELGDPDDLARKIAYVLLNPREAIETVERGQDVYTAHAWNQEREVLVGLVGGLLSSRVSV